MGSRIVRLKMTLKLIFLIAAFIAVSPFVWCAIDYIRIAIEEISSYLEDHI